ncbi:Uncharacterised protein [Vibrio cholerae]|nr:Uncharacterised protein [Vibrio cholerae]
MGLAAARMKSSIRLTSYVIELIKMVKAHVVGNHLIGKKRAIKKVRQAL